MVERGAPETAGSGVLAFIEALPTSGLGERGGQDMQPLTDRPRVEAFVDQVGDGGQVCVEQEGDVLAMFGGDDGDS
ncbi:hypothetical protein [Streptomyces sp. Rer75]|uniref:hypothetical protein n=1 Tax=Streptomyces sp. Rer75 TaxID=2750011 RepID=UPI0015CF9E4F|nr:hypothetical protein [Streptomyces sp. Rer75]QLH19300.1 hypothetical protein HYQ63_00140 [Streptomyces sp. Rer75]